MFIRGGLPVRRHLREAPQDSMVPAGLQESGMALPWGVGSREDRGRGRPGSLGGWAFLVDELPFVGRIVVCADLGLVLEPIGLAGVGRVVGFDVYNDP